MKKLLSIFLSIMLCLSFTACKKNIVEYELADTVLMTYSGEELVGDFGDLSKYSLKIDMDNMTLEYCRGGKTFSATLESPVEKTSQTAYTLKWDKSPELVEGFEVFDTEFAISSDHKEAILYFHLRGNIQGYTVTVMLCDWWM